MYEYLLWEFTPDETQLGSWDIINDSSGVGARELYEALKASNYTTIITHHPQLLIHALSPFVGRKNDITITIEKRNIKVLDINALTGSHKIDIPKCEAVFKTWKEVTKDSKKVNDLPLTRVQVLRQQVKNVMSWKNMSRLKSRLNQPLDMSGFRMYKQAKQGGIMFVNQVYAGETLHNVYDYDLNSAYTAACLTELFPSNLGTQIKPTESRLGSFNTLSTVRFRNLQCVGRFPYLYIKAAKIIGRFPILENNRIVECDYVEVTLTPMDWERVKETYVWDELEIVAQRIFGMEPLPRPIKKIIFDITYNDIVLKGVRGREDDRALNKVLKNSMTGMFGELKDESQLTRERYYNPFWYIWLTSYVRCKLHKVASDHPDTTVYVNTDGIALTEQDDAYFDALDKEAWFKMEAVGFEFPKKIPGLWDCEVYQDYKTLGVNKEWRDGELKLGGYLVEPSRELLETIEDFTYDFRGVRPTIYRCVEGGKFKKVSKEYADMISLIESCSKLTCA